MAYLYSMYILLIGTILSFSLWTIFRQGGIAKLFRLAFFVCMAGWIITTVKATGSLAASFPTISVFFIAIAFFGYVIQNIATSVPARVIITILATGPLWYLHQHPTIDVLPAVFHHTDLALDPEGELIVKCSPGKLKAVQQKLQELHFVVSTTPWQPSRPETTELDDYLVVNTKGNCYKPFMLRVLEQVSDIIWIEENELWAVTTEPLQDDKETYNSTTRVNDPLVSRQYAFDLLELDLFHAIIRSSGIAPQRPAKLFILDSGVDFDHEDLAAAAVSHPSSSKKSNETDTNGHGTHCAGIAAAVTNNGIGIASYNPGAEFVEVGSVAVINRLGFATQASIVQGLIEAIDAGADVVNMSFGGRSNQLQEETYNDLLKYAAQHNVILVAAAGNSAADAANYMPSGRNEVITVAAINKYNEKAQFSNYVQNTTYGIAAPGVSILSTYKNGTYGTLDGTSMAAPQVAGLIAVLRAINPSLTTEEAWTTLAETGTRSDNPTATGPIIAPVEALKAMLD